MHADIVAEAPTRPPADLPEFDAARPALPATSAPSSGEFLTFRLGAEEYAIDILRVQEIRGVVQPTRLAQAPRAVSGVVNLRGVIVPIVDLRLAFGLQAINDPATVTIILIIAGRVIGVTVDAVSDVVTVAAESIRPPPEFASACTSDAIVGLASLGEGTAQRTLIVTDIQRLMASPEMGLF